MMAMFLSILSIMCFIISLMFLAVSFIVMAVIVKYRYVKTLIIKDEYGCTKVEFNNSDMKVILKPALWTDEQAIEHAKRLSSVDIKSIEDALVWEKRFLDS